MAKAYYDPRPGKQEPGHSFDVFLAKREGSPAEVEYDELDEELTGKYTNIADPERRQAKADAEARRTVVRKYRLPKNWEPAGIGELGVGGAPVDGQRIRITDTSAGEASLPPVLECLNGDGGTIVFRGCPYDADRYPPVLRSDPRTNH